MKYLNSKRRFAIKAMAMFLLVTFVGQIIQPTAAFALTGGPSQPEITQFQQVSASDMVDLFTGDFSYNIPLFEVPGPNGGYPFNLSYQSAPSMDQEASWVGLGWNVSPGAIVRNMRGLPDDFDGQKIKREVDMKSNITVGVGVNFNYEFLSGDLSKGVTDNNLTGNSLSMGIRIYYNNYKGMGYTFQPGASFTFNKGSKNTVGMGFNFSFDTQDGGVGANLDLNLSREFQNTKGKIRGLGKNSYSLGIGYNSNAGINASYSYSRTTNGYRERSANSKKGSYQYGTFGGSAGSSISFAYPFTTPSIGLEMSGGNFTGSATIGFDPAIGGLSHLYGGFSFFIDVTEVANRNEALKSYGYLNYHNKGANNESALVDFNRENDNVFREKSTTNLHSTSLTYDYYMINGQGTGGMFRPYRNEVGYVHEPSRMSGSGGGSLGFNIPGDGKKIGINVGFNFSDARTGRWDPDQNDLVSNSTYSNNFGDFRAKQDADNMNYEGPYFKMNGNMSVLNQSNFNALGGEDAVRFHMNDNENVVRRKLINKYSTGSFSTPQNVDSPDDISVERRPRGQNVTPVYNHLLLNNSAYESLNEMRVSYYTSITDITNDLLTPSGNSNTSRVEMEDGKNIRESHIGGFIVTNPDGNRYVYGLPAYNNETKEHMYTSVPDKYGECQTHRELDLDNNGAIRYKFISDVTTSQDDKYDITDQFKSITTTPSYTHSHLLSSILGTDYVDSDGTPGPSDNDYGYWVKFTYVKTSSNYCWRSPFTGASYNAGSEASYEDDKINYTSGTKEIWYVATVETKTHVAIFEMSERMDAKGAAADINNFHPSGSHMDQTDNGKQYKLDKIKLFAKQEYLTAGANAMPIQTIHFEYDYSLCPGVPNNSGAVDKNENEFGIQTGPNINQGVPNPNFDSNKPEGVGNMATIYGKLTLKAVYFTYKNDFTGKNHKYKFNYTSNKPYEYVNNRYDRWGSYNWYTNQGQCTNADFVYTNQFPQHPFPNVNGHNYDPYVNPVYDYNTESSQFKDETDAAAAAWCLNKIDLPSGGSINVEYESDDYAYVQHQEATQMFKITSFGYGHPTDVNDLERSWLYNEDVDIQDLGTGDNSLAACTRKRKVFFRLEKPIKADNFYTAQQIHRMIYNDYIHPLRRGDEYQVYINARVNLQGGIYENIASYYNLDINPGDVNALINNATTLPDDGSSAPTVNGCNFSPNPELPFGVWQGETNMTVDGLNGDYYTHGYVVLKNSQIDNFDPLEAAKYHPISVNTWYYMKENLSKILYSIQDLDPGNEDYERIIRGGSLLSIFPQIAAMFRGLPAHCYNSNFATQVDLDRSWIKLATPDGKKYGGGCRVKKLYMQDDNQWAEDSQVDQIGQVYDYSIEEDKFNDITGQHVVKTISSGVATYEPIIGGEENALKFAKFYSKDIPLKSANQSYYEGPYNESYYPAAQVGYRKVTVSSLPTNLLRTLDQTPPPSNPTSIQGIKATGLTVNEFYTAKDFPTLSYETDLHRQTIVEAIVPIPLIGTITDKQAVGSQGYVIRLNDMHGKPKSVTSYGIKPDGKLSDIPTSKVEYIYKSRELIYEGKRVSELVNEVDVLVDDPNMRGEDWSPVYPEDEDPTDHEAKMTKATIGMDYEFFYDMRQSYIKSGQGGLDFNLDLLGFGPFSCPIPLPWPSYSQSYAKVNTIVTNKIIQKTAIMDRVIATDGQSTVITQNLVFDPLTGAPLLTMVNNNFNEPVYNYSVPGRLMYSGLDASYKNDLLEFSYTPTSGSVLENSSQHTIEVTDGSTFKNSISNNNITMADMLPLLHQGDEFILEKVTTNEKFRAYLLTGLNDHQTECPGSPSPITSLKFYIKNFSGSVSLAVVGTVYKLTLVRSGRRNLLDNTVGSIVSLNCKEGEFKVDPNAANYPTAQALIAHSPLKNRFKKQIGSPSTSTFGYTAYLPQWLNSIMVPDPTFTNVLPLGMYDNSVLPANLADKIQYIIIGNSIAELDDPDNPSNPDDCLECPDYTNEDGSFPSGYSIFIKIKDEFGGNCIFEPCIARKYHEYDPLDGPPQVLPASLAGFSNYVDYNCTVTAYYHNGSFWGPPFSTNLPTEVPQGTQSRTFSCYQCPSITIDPSIFHLKNILQASAYESTDIWGDLDADMYATGNKGIWRPKINYYYKDDRFQATDKSVALSTDGVFDGDPARGGYNRLFYLFNWYANANHPMPKEWILNNQITQYNKNGVAIETKDILDIYNATVFDRNTNLPIAIADNTKKQEILVFNFDNNDLPAYTAVNNCAFTGKKSLRVTTNQTITFNFNDDFKLEENKTYLISAWAGGYNMLKSPKLLDVDHSTQMNIKIEYVGATGISQFKPSGLIYEGVGDSYWRRIEGSFTVPVGATGIKVTLMGRASGYGNQTGFTDDYAYFDDIRLHPAQSIMKTFVYDEVDFKLRSELDENNYPMYYGYDASGQLTVVKVLTENGIKTIKEAYSNTKR